jgi:uncharacterized protein
MTAEELVADREAIGELRHLGAADPEARPGVHRYAFDPAQDHKLPVGREVADPRTRRIAGTLVDLDAAHGTLELRRSAKAGEHPAALVPPAPIPSTVLQQALLSLADHVATHGTDGPGPWRAARELLLRRPPRLLGAGRAALVEPGEDAGDALVRLARALDGSCLPVQGPPGSGKTHHGARAIVELVRRGKRVAITAPSHAAITNLLDEVCVRAGEAGVALRALQRAGQDQCSTAPQVARAEGNAAVVAALDADEVDVVAGTAWLFARPELRDRFSVLVVDEAGQLSLANTLAVSGAATNLVLLGDPQQLAQPSSGTHPDGAEASALDHVLGEAATIAPDRGLFLDHSHRMHPDICRLVSAVAYEGRLRPAPGCERRAVAPGPLVGGAGVRWWPVDHTGNRTRSVEEAEVVGALARALLGRMVTDDAGAARPLGPDDVLVIAPYNAQVAVLSEHVPAGVRVGTVDRFQGQQAPVVLYSLAASSAADVPRGIGFLLSVHRLNVAVSRAQALTVVVGSPALLQAPVATTTQLCQVNALCRLVEEAELVGPS